MPQTVEQSMLRGNCTNLKVRVNISFAWLKYSNNPLNAIERHQVSHGSFIIVWKLWSDNVHDYSHASCDFMYFGVAKGFP